MFTLKKIAVAAAVLAIFTFATWYFLLNGNSSREANNISKTLTNDILAPVTSNAILTMSDGKTIILDSVAEGSLAVQGNTNIIKLADGELVYQGSGTGNNVQYNVLEVPRGSKVVHLTLSDGTKVWLNAASSLKYPVYFSGSERKIEITGEAYFEVSKDAHRPFIVQKKNENLKVEVLGTHFNINAYDDEIAAKITLLEGKVNVLLGKEKQRLNPGQQALVNQQIKLVDNADIKQVMAWKEGKFDFGEKSRSVFYYAAAFKMV